MSTRRGLTIRGKGWIALVALLVSMSAFAQTNDKPLQIFRALDNKAESLKAKALELNRDLIMIEEESFIPSSAQLVVFFSLVKKLPPQLENLHLKLTLDDEIVANHIYTPREIDALFRNGKHRLYLGSLPVGSHRLKASIAGKGKQGFEAHSQIEFDKGWERRFLDIELALNDKKGAPTISIKTPATDAKQ